MKLLLLFSVVVCIAACSKSSTIRTAARPPATRVAPVTDSIHGVAVTDNYRWLEGDDADPQNPGKVTPEVAAWTDEQNAYTRTVLDGLPGRKALEDRLRPLMEIGAINAPDVRANRYFFAKRRGSEQQPTIYWREGADGPDRVLIDPAKIDAVRPHDRRMVLAIARTASSLAYGTYRAGDENTTLHLIEVDTGRVLPLEIPNKTQSPNWLPDGSGFVYQNLKNPEGSV